MYTFTTNSKGGIGAIGRLCKAYGVAMREHADQYPVIELGVGTYKHTEFGKIPFPTFEIVDWVDASVFDEGEEAAPASARKKIRAR